jgi:CBS domain-containing protein
MNHKGGICAMPFVKDLLDRKGSAVFSTTPSSNVLDATELMNQHRVGALLVIDSDSVVGIFTERDVLTRVVGSGKSPAEIAVGEVMTHPVAYCTRETPVEVCKAIFTEKRIRHMPVMEGNRVIGLVATGDVMAFEAHSLQQTVRYLEEYINS